MTTAKLIGLAMAAAMTTGAAQAYGSCGKREAIVKVLEANHGEVFAGGGIETATRIYEVWTSGADGSWTILMTTANGTSCVMASGTDWREGVVVPEGVPG
ncbi:MAG: hypothetical protein QNJ16_06750 [Rhodobacter sp.]|nr:hypothetical protein [Rhodobacter sp.]